MATKSTEQYVNIREVPGRGEGVFAKRNLTPADRIYAGSRTPEDAWSFFGQYRDADLKICSGCKVARFCGEQCQRQAWKKYHKYECKIFVKLYPKILPESVRAIVRLALQHKHDLLPQGTWLATLRLVSHYKEFERAGGNDLMNLMLMAKAAAEYSKAADENTFLLLLCILKTNAITLQTAYNDPIGLLLDPFLATMNHSCDANVYLHRPTYTNNTGWLQRKQTAQVALEIMPLRNIVEGEELTISYIDFQRHVSERQSELQKNYFFTCTCAKCVSDISVDTQLRESDPKFASLQAHWRARANEHIKKSTNTFLAPEPLSKTTSTLTDIANAMEKHPNFSPTIDPYNRVIQELKLLYMSESKACDLALTHALKQHLIIGPQLYSSPIHPTRIVNALYVLHILALLDETFQQNHDHGPAIERQRKEVEKRGLSRQSFRYWRIRICVEMKKPLMDSVAQDLAQCFAMEEASIGPSDRDALEYMLTSESIKTKAEEDMRRLLGVEQQRWEDVKRHWIM
ncbi:hypothetical protein LTS08_000282 [Lithohypha guttulata]|nr:hypothetical protein LTS08_000282 [Lithohypha guttulata]